MQNAPPIGSADETRQAMSGCQVRGNKTGIFLREFSEINHSSLQDLCSSKSMVNLMCTYLEIAPVVNPTRYENTFFSSIVL
jgi:hypothetical protein